MSPPAIVRTPVPRTRLTRTPVSVGDAELIERIRQKTIGRKVDAPPVPENRLSNLLDQPPEYLDEDSVASMAEVSAADGDPSWDEATAAMMLESCVFFAQEILTGPPEPPYNGKFLVGPHHIEWDELAASQRRVCILAPRDHGKTYFWDLAFPIWKAMREKNGIGFIFSATQDQAVRILEDIRNEIESNPRLKFLEPKNKLKKGWSSTRLVLGNGHRIYARGFGTKVRGAHPSWIVVDDGINDESAYSETTRRKSIDYFYTAITNMVIPGGQIVVVGTPFHQDDLYGDLERNDQYMFKRYQALSATEEPLWPARYSKERLLTRRAEIGSIRFTREFLCQPIADDMSLFPGYLFRGEVVEQPTLKLGMPLEFWKGLGVQIFMGVDFAMSSSVQADFTVIFVMGLDAAGNRWLLDIVREKGLPYQEQLSLINREARLYEPGLIFLEANQMQRIFGDELIRTTDLPVKQFVTGVQKNSLDKGVPSLRVLLENKKFRIPRGDKRSVELTDVWINEMRSFTWQDGKLQGVGAHDDTVMACWICDQAVRQGAFDFSFGDEKYEGTFEDFLKDQMGGEEAEAEEKAEVKRKAGATAPGTPKPPKEASGSLIDDRAALGLPPGLHFGYDW